MGLGQPFPGSSPPHQLPPHHPRHPHADYPAPNMHALAHQQQQHHQLQHQHSLPHQAQFELHSASLLQLAETVGYDGGGGGGGELYLGQGLAALSDGCVVVIFVFLWCFLVFPLLIVFCVFLF